MPIELKSCTLCGCREFQEVEAYNDDKIQAIYMACVQCGLVALSPRPTEAELIEYYTGKYWKERTLSVPRLRTKQARRAEFIVALIESNLSSCLVNRKFSDFQIVLEIGSSFGETLATLCARLRQLGSKPCAFAIEPETANIQAGSCNYESVTLIGRFIADLNHWHGEKFELVILSHVLEHLTDPVASLQMIRNQLSEHGLVYIEVPNFYGHPSAEYAHSFCFTETSLTNCLAMAGFKAVALVVNGHEEDFPFYLSCLAVRDGTPSRLLPESWSVIDAKRKAGREAFRRFREQYSRPV
jgi:SAM-dependent methyltransferase